MEEYGWEIKPIAKSAMKLISFDYGPFKFIDSRRFLNSSEECLADQLANRKVRDDGTIDYSKENFDKFKQLSIFFRTS